VAQRAGKMKKKADGWEKQHEENQTPSTG